VHFSILPRTGVNLFSVDVSTISVSKSISEFTFIQPSLISDQSADSMRLDEAIKLSDIKTVSFQWKRLNLHKLRSNWNIYIFKTKSQIANLEWFVYTYYTVRNTLLKRKRFLLRPNLSNIFVFDTIWRNILCKFFNHVIFYRTSWSCVS